MEPDFFVSDLDISKLNLPDDSLEHERVAKLLLAHMQQLEPPSVISIEGAWGSGKSDLMCRMFRELKSNNDKDCHPFWINPWQYGTADLLTPLVTQVAQQVKERNRMTDAIKSAIKMIVIAGVNFGLKSVAAPYATTLEAIWNDEAIKDLVGRLTGDKPAEKDGNKDAVASMAEAFRTLVRGLAPDDEAVERQMVFVFVDDIDRCLPDRQVAVLEALRFLLSANAKARFVVAMDPFLATQSLAKRFRVPQLDTERFLDKLFHLRFHLATLGSEQLDQLLNATCKMQIAVSEGRGVEPERSPNRLIKDDPAVLLLAERVFGKRDWRSSAAKVFFLEGVNNPRTIGRAIRRLGIFAALKKPETGWNSVPDNLEESFFAWLALSVRWPEARRAFQYVAAQEGSTWNDFRAIVGIPSRDEASARTILNTVRNLKFKALAKDGAFVAFIGKVFPNPSIDTIKRVEQMFRQAGI